MLPVVFPISSLIGKSPPTTETATQVDERYGPPCSDAAGSRVGVIPDRPPYDLMG